MRKREQKGIPSGGQFAVERRPEAEAEPLLPSPESQSDQSPSPQSSPASPDDERMPLQDYRVVGFARKEFSPGDGIVQPGGVCGHCGAGLINCVRVRHNTTGEEMDVGLSCAERTGLDKSGLKRLMAERYAEERAARWEAQQKVSRAEQEAAEAEATEKFGEHGTSSRYLDGTCRCDECLAAAPHGTLDRMWATDCYCPECVEGAVASGDYEVMQKTVLIDAETGEMIPEAKMVSTRYGLRWMVERGEGTTWYPFKPKRRSTMFSKGVLEAEANALWRISRRNRGSFPVSIIEQPTHDLWGEPLSTD